MSTQSTTLRQVARRPIHNGVSGWAEILGPAPARPALAGALSCDVAIVGAGFAGLSAARRLTQLAPDARVVVVDAGRVAEGASGRNSGFMIDLPHELTSQDYAGAGEGRDRVLTRLNRQAIDWAGEAVRDYAIPQGFFQCSGKINGAASELGFESNASYAAHLAALGETHELLDARAMREITGSNYYQGGLFTPGTAMLQPAGYIRGLAAGIERAGVTICEQSPVQQFESVASGWRLQCPGGVLTATRVVLATNGHLESFGFNRGQLMHIMLSACMTEELSDAQLRLLGGHDCWGITPAHPMGATLRRISTAQGGNRIIIRQGGSYRPGMQNSIAELKRLERRMRGKFDARFPQLSGIAFQHAWSGHLCLSRTGVSVMRELEPGLHAACVCNGLGTARGTLMGMAAAERICGHSSTIADFFEAEVEPLRLPPHPFDSIGANAYMRWKEWEARRE